MGAAQNWLTEVGFKECKRSYRFARSADGFGESLVRVRCCEDALQKFSLGAVQVPIGGGSADGSAGPAKETLASDGARLQAIACN